ncbi:hypothetical protein ABZV91_29580 [Nocardia sp. NPDC004568]
MAGAAAILAGTNARIGHRKPRCANLAVLAVSAASVATGSAFVVSR